MLKMCTASILFVLTLLIISCRDDESEPVPSSYVNMTINLNNPAYSDLNAIGGWMYFDEGHRGMIVHHTFDGYYIAMDRACTYHPNDDCAKVSVESSNITIACGQYDDDGDFEKCCSSKFQMNGSVMEGPASYPLRHFEVRQNGSNLNIRN
jgi:hypothetical protein